jgi:DNA-binding transcriptional MerR regulator
VGRTLARSGAPLRIGELATRTGTTPRTIRYYEEIGLLPGGDHERGKHRVYSDRDIERLRELTRLRDHLGLTLAELRALVEAEDARAALRERWHRTHDPVERRAIAREALRHLAVQLDLVRSRKAALAELERGFVAKRRQVQRILRELEAEAQV